MKICIIFLLFLMIMPAAPLECGEIPEILTVAEASGFKATSRHVDVLEFISQLQTHSSRIRVETICTTAEGKTVPLLIIGDPPPSSPAQLRSSGKIPVYIQANIHAGEVEGKEASLMLARDLLFGEFSKYLDRLVVLICPNFNPDGNDKISKNNRRSQKGPVDGVGIRYNGQNLDLNRDGLKLESHEVSGMVRNVLNRWDPVLLVDCHTHNGSYHQEPVTYVWNLNPNGERSVIKFMSERMIPWLKKTLQEKHGIPSVPHGDFVDVRDPEKGWRTTAPEPRYLTNYIGLRNRMAILNENYPYVDYKTRVIGCYHFLDTCLAFCAANRNDIFHLIRDADRDTIRRGLDPAAAAGFIVEFDLQALPGKFTLLGYEMELVQREGSRRPRVRPTERKKTYRLPYLADYRAKRTVPFPAGYLICENIPEVREKLLQHGILVEGLKRSVSVEVTSFRVKGVKAAARLYQGHYLNRVQGEYAQIKKEFPPGSLYISTAQPLGNVAAYLLEPESDDGLIVWNYFDRYLAAQWGRGEQIYPVYKLMTPVHFVKERIVK